MVGPPKEVLQRPGNRVCADCETRDPRWASINLGIFICETCAGIHRDLGTHISKVKSVNLDEWKTEFVDVMKAIGNNRSNAYYEKNVPEGVKYIGGSHSAGGDKIDEKEAKKLKVWIRAKYEEKKYAPPGVDEPRVRVARGESLDAPAEGPVAKPAPGGGLDSLAAPAEDSSRKVGKTSKDGKSRKDKDKSPSPPAALGQAEPELSGKDKKAKKEKKRERSRARTEGTADSSPQGVDSFGTGGGASPRSTATAPAAVSAPQGSPPQPAAQLAAPPQAFGMQPPAAAPPSSGGGCTGSPQSAVSWDQQQAFGGGGFAPPSQHQAHSGVGYTPPAGGGLPGGQNLDQERRAALQAIARLLTDPMGLLGVPLDASQALLPLFGFDVQAAEFHPAALKRKKDGDGVALGLPVSRPLDFRRPAAEGGASNGSAPWGPEPIGSPPWSPEPTTAASRLGTDLSLEGAASPANLGPLVKAAVGSELSLFQGELQRLRAEMQVLQKDYGRLKDEKEDRSRDRGSRHRESRDERQLRDNLRSAGILSRRESGTSDLGDSWWKNEPSGTGLSGPTSPISAFSRPSEVVPAAREGAGTWSTPATGPCRDREGAPGATSTPGLRNDFSSWSSPSRSPCSIDASMAGEGVSAAAFASSAAVFRERDRDCDGYLTGTEARDIFSHSGLEPEELGIIWALCDVSRDGKLCLEELVCLSELVEWRKSGRDIPMILPPELWKSACEMAERLQDRSMPAAPEGSPWEVTAEEARRYCEVFAALVHPGDGALGGAEVRAVLEATRLGAADLAQVWHLSDIDADGRLTRGEFACALHLASCLVQGHSLPETLPPELVAACTSIEAGQFPPPLPPPTAGQPSPFFGGAEAVSTSPPPLPPPGTSQDLLAAAAAAAPASGFSVLWAPSGEEIRSTGPSSTSRPWSRRLVGCQPWASAWRRRSWRGPECPRRSSPTFGSFRIWTATASSALASSSVLCI